jgi:hypothetical protein
MKLKHLIQGWRNNILPPADQAELINQIHQKRMKECNRCEKHSKNHSTPFRPDDHCVECGCNLNAKTKCLECECPLKKWLKVNKE